MAEITAALVKELREMTGAGMMECKKALVESAGDIDAAVEVLRKRGLANAAKKAGRIAAEGLVTVKAAENGKSAAIVEVNSETDFVAKNELFRNYVANVAAQALASESADMDSFMAEPWVEDPTVTVKDALVQKISVIGENLQIRRFEKVVTDGYVGSYIHGGGRIGVLVELACSEVNDAVREVAKNVAMQVAALNPKFLCREEIPGDYLAKEKEILMEQASKENKPLNILEKMVEGRIAKEMKEICLVDQLYFKDDEMSVGKYVEKAAKEIGSPVSIKRYIRFETGEGIAKKEENFAEEVAKQMQK